MTRTRPRRGPTRHHYIEDPDWEGYCLACNLPASNAVHDLPEPDREQLEHERRRLGERR